MLDNTDVKRYHEDIKIIKEELKMAVSFNGKHLAKFIRPEEYEAIYPQVELAHNQLESKTGAGNDFLGWLDLPVTYRYSSPADGGCRLVGW